VAEEVSEEAEEEEAAVEAYKPDEAEEVEAKVLRRYY
jgi:hypothetical protein